MVALKLSACIFVLFSAVFWEMLLGHAFRKLFYHELKSIKYKSSKYKTTLYECGALFYSQVLYLSH